MKTMGHSLTVWAAGLLATVGSVSAVTLADCEKAALEANPGLEAMRHRVEGAGQAHAQTLAPYYPVLGTSAEATLTDNPSQAFMSRLNQRSLSLDSGLGDPGDTENLRLELFARYSLYDGGRRGLERKMADRTRVASEADLVSARNQLMFQVRRSYYSLLQARAFMLVAMETVTSYEENLRVAKARIEAGTAVKTDVLNLEVKLAQAREDRIRAGNRMKLALAALTGQTGND